MMPWTERPIEERGLLNPSFCAVLLWYAALGHQSYPGTLMLPFETSFLVLPMILHRETRESLPKTVATSLAVWLEENPLARARIAERARVLVPFTREALSFGGLHGFLVFSGGTVSADSRWKKKVDSTLRGCSDEVHICARGAEFLGKWFAKTGNAATVMELFGVRP